MLLLILVFFSTLRYGFLCYTYACGKGAVWMGAVKDRCCFIPAERVLFGWVLFRISAALYLRMGCCFD